MTRASRSRMPASPSPCARKAKFASWVRPDRISFPIIRTQAVTISGAVSLLGIICSLSPRPGAFIGNCLRRHNHRPRIAAGRLHSHLQLAAPRLPRYCPTPIIGLSRKPRPLRTDTNDIGMQQDVMMGLAPYEARDRAIKIHGPEAFEGMRRAGMLAAETLDFITPHVRAGITTGELDRLCHGFIVDHDAIPAPLNYR